MISTIPYEELGTIEDLKLFYRMKYGGYKYSMAIDFLARIYLQAGE